MVKIIHILPHTIEEFIGDGDYSNFDHHSIRFMEKIRRFSRRETFDLKEELWTLSKKGLSATLRHKKGFTVRLFPLSLKLPLPLEISFPLLKAVYREAVNCFPSPQPMVSRSQRVKREEVIWHLHSYYLLMNDFISFILWLKKQKFILHFHGGGPSFKSIKSVFYTIYHYLIGLKISLNLANGVIVLNRDEEKRLIKFLKIKREKVFYFPNTVPANLLALGQKLKKSSPQGFRLVIAGRQAKLIQPKFFSLLNNVLSKKKSCFLYLIGLTRQNKEIAYLKKEFPRQVELNGWLSQKALLKKFRSAHLYLHLFQKNEGLPIILVEALSQGLPVLAFDVEGVRDVVKNNENGWLVSSPKEFSEKLEEIIAQPFKVERMRKNCVASIKNNFLDEQYFPRLIKIYKSLL